MEIKNFKIIENVYRTEDHVLLRAIRNDDDRRVLIKTSRGENPSLPFITRLKYDYEIGKGLSVNGVISYLQLLEIANHIALVMEDETLLPLYRFMQTRKFPVVQFLTIAAELSTTINDLHNHKIIFRNISSRSVFLQKNNLKPGIADFSLAIPLNREKGYNASPNYPEGNPVYISPEQTGRINRIVDYRTDFYSLGVLFYEMLLGFPPFTSREPMELVYNHLAKIPKPPNELNENIPETVSGIIMKLLAKSPDERYQSGEGLKADLIRCREELSSGGACVFELGENDVPDKFRIPDKLYGRNSDIAFLEQVFDRVQSGRSAFVLIDGVFGIGKTSLVRVLQPSVHEKNGAFCLGKCEKQKKNTPFYCIIMALRELLKTKLLENEESIVRLKKKIDNQTDTDFDILFKMLPELEMLTGKKVSASLPESTDSQFRLNRIFKIFIQLFASNKTPLLITLDDIQWIDPASLNLLHYLLSEKDVFHLLIIGTCTFSEEDISNRYLETLLNRIDSTGTKVAMLKPQPMNVQNIVDMLIDTLHRTTSDILPFAELLHEMTGGIPSYIRQILESLHEKELLTYDRRQRRWNGSLMKIREAAATENLAGFSEVRIESFPVEIRETLKIAACIGNRFDAETIAAVLQKTEKEVSSVLWDAVRRGIILPHGQVWEHLEAQLTEKKEESSLQYRFVHDRFQQACYTLLKENEKKRMHLTIGRYQKETFDGKNLDDHIFEIVEQLNAGISLIENKKELLQTARFNSMAGSKAKRTGAYETALKYYRIAHNILTALPEKHQHKLTLEITCNLAECEFLEGNREQAQFLFDDIYQRARTNFEKGEIANIRIRLYTNSGNYQKALNLGIATLKRLGLILPDRFSKWEAAVKIELNRIESDCSQLLNQLSEIEITSPDKEKQLCMSLLQNLVVPSYNFERNLFILIVIKMVNYSRLHGYFPQTPTALIHFSMILISEKNDFQKGFEFTDLAVKIVDNTVNFNEKGRFYYLLSRWIDFLRKPFDNNLAMLKDSRDSCLKTGDLVYAGFSATHTVIVTFFSGRNLGEVKQELAAGLDLIRQTRNYHVEPVLNVFQRLILNLTGKTGGSYTFSGKGFDESLFLHERRKGNNQVAIYLFFLFKGIAHFIHGSYPQAQSAFETAGDAHFLKGDILHLQFLFFSAMANAMIYDQAPSEKQKALRKNVSQTMEWMKNLAGSCPENFSSMYLLLCAELSRIENKPVDAMNRYDEAIENFARYNNIFLEALANDLAAQFYLSIGRNRFSRLYLNKSRYAYMKWGAVTLAENLEKRYPESEKEEITTPEQEPYRETGFAPAKTETSIDMTAIVRTYRAISGEIVLEKLLEKLIVIVLENAGARKCSLILKENDQLKVKAYFDVDETGEVRMCSLPLEDFTSIPSPMVYYTDRTQNHVLLNNAEKNEMFNTDPYIRNFRPKSILCQPIKRHGKGIGVLYLENNLTEGAFTKSHLEVLDLLSSQAAISLENAKLYRQIDVSEKKFRSLYENAVEGIFQITVEGKILNANPAMAALMGYASPEEMIENVTDIAGQIYYDREDIRKFMKIIMKQNQIVGFETRMKRVNGEIFWSSISARVIKDDQGRPHYFEGSMLDISERKKREEAEREKTIAEEANKKIMGSIRYAQIIQSSLLPNPENSRRYLPDSFSIWMPRDIVGGDILFMEPINDSVVIALMDCTGHGVPGAFMTVIACMSFHQLVRLEGYRNPAAILKQLNSMVKSSLQQDSKSTLSDDGLDAGICRLTPAENRLVFAGARIPLYYTKDNEVITIKGDRHSIGYKKSDIDFDFTSHNVTIENGISFYMTSDGLIQQLGEEKRLPFGTRRFREIIKQHHKKPFETQKQILLKEFDDYKGSNERLDDVTVVGFACS